MVSYIIAYFASLISLVLLDYIWLGVIMQSSIQKRLGGLMREKILLGPAIAFYVLYTIAIIIFATSPALTKQSWLTAALYGGLLGFTAYMTYDMTNWATLKSRPVAMVLPDILWGAFVTAVVAVVGYFVYNAL